MAKKKQTQAKEPAADPAEASSFGDEAIPSVRARSILTIALTAHAFLLLVSYGSVVETSDVQARLKIFFSWYLNPLHLNVDGRPIFLLHQDDDAAAIRFQVRAVPVEPDDDPLSDVGWRPVPPSGWVGGEERKRYQRWAATTAMLAQQEEVGLAGALARRAVIDDDARTVRLVLLNNPVTDQIPAFDRELYRAAIVREADQVRFVRLSEPRENAMVSKPAERPRERTEGSENAGAYQDRKPPQASAAGSDE